MKGHKGTGTGKRSDLSPGKTGGRLKGGHGAVKTKGGGHGAGTGYGMASAVKGGKRK